MQRSKPEGPTAGLRPEECAGKVLLADSRFMMSLPEWQGAFDVIATDPPYRISKADMTRTGGATLTRDFDEEDEPLDIDVLAVQFSQVLRADASLIVWCADNQIEAWRASLSDLFDRVVVGGWAKTNPAPSVRKRRWLSALEFWLWAGRGAYRFNYGEHREMYNVDHGPHLGPSDQEWTGHPNQKPEVICRRHLRALASHSDLILDPFAGSGSYGAAAKSMGLRCVSVERKPERNKVASDRVANVREQMGLF